LVVKHHRIAVEFAEKINLCLGPNLAIQGDDKFPIAFICSNDRDDHSPADNPKHDGDTEHEERRRPNLSKPKRPT